MSTLTKTNAVSVSEVKFARTFSATSIVWNKKEKRFEALYTNIVKAASSVFAEMLEEENLEIAIFSMDAIGKRPNPIKGCTEYATFSSEKHIPLFNFGGFDEKGNVLIRVGNKRPTKSQKEEMWKAIANAGVYVGGTVFFPVLRSAAQSRCAKIYMSNLQGENAFDEIHAKLAHQSFTKYFSGEKEVSMAKLESRLALTASATRPTGVTLGETQHQITSDHYRVVEDVNVLSLVKSTEGTPRAYSEVIKNKIVVNTTDGSGQASPLVYAKILHGSGHMNEKDYRVFSNYFKGETATIEKALNIPGLARIIKTMPSSAIIRIGAAQKCNLIMWDLKAEGLGNTGLYLPESAVKDAYQTEEGVFVTDTSMDAEVRVCSVNTSEWGRAKSSNQITGALNFTKAEIKDLVRESQDLLVSLAQTDFAKALELAGARATLDELGGEGVKLAQVLGYGGEVALADAWVREQLKRLIMRKLTGVRFGEFLVEGSFYRVTCDPRLLHMNNYKEADLLQAGECYLDGKEKEFALARSPFAHGVEAAVLKGVNTSKLAHLHALLIINPFDTTAPGAQGMDFDGDGMLVTDNPHFIAAIKRCKARYANHFDVIEQSLDGKAKMETYSKEAMYNEYAENAELNRVGMLSNNVVTTTDLIQHIERVRLLAKKEIETLGSPEKSQSLAHLQMLGKIVSAPFAEAGIEAKTTTQLLDELERNCRELSVLIGGEIDSVKADIDVTISEYLSLMAKPLHEYERQAYHIEAEAHRHLSRAEIQAVVAERIAKDKAKKDGFVVYSSLSGLGLCARFADQNLAEIEAKIQGIYADRPALETYFPAMFTEEDISSVTDRVLRTLKSYASRSAEIRKARDKFVRELADGELITAEEAKSFQEMHTHNKDVHTAIMNRISDNQALLAYVVYMHCAAQESKKDANGTERIKTRAAWNLCFDGMIELLASRFAATRISLSAKYAGSEKVRVTSGGVYVDGELDRTASVIAYGEYDIVKEDGRPYIYAPITTLPQKQEKNVFTEAQLHMAIWGFLNDDVTSTEEAIHFFKDSLLTIHASGKAEEADYLCHEGRVVGRISLANNSRDAAGKLLLQSALKSEVPVRVELVSVTDGYAKSLKVNVILRAFSDETPALTPKTETVPAYEVFEYEYDESAVAYEDHAFSYEYNTSDSYEAMCAHYDVPQTTVTTKPVVVTARRK